MATASVEPKTAAELRAMCERAGVDPSDVFSLKPHVPPGNWPRCLLCGAPFLTVAACVVRTSESPLRHLAHVDCVAREREPPFADRLRGHAPVELEPGTLEPVAS